MDNEIENKIIKNKVKYISTQPIIYMNTFNNIQKIEWL